MTSSALQPKRASVPAGSGPSPGTTVRGRVEVLPNLKALNLETTLDPASSPLSAVFVPPARPGESSCSGGSRHRGFRALWPLPVTVFAVTCAVKVVGCAVTGAMTTVTRGREPAPAVTGSVPAVIAVAGCPSGPAARASTARHARLARSRNVHLRV
jgi:hypothetical protein